MFSVTKTPQFRMKANIIIDWVASITLRETFYPTFLCLILTLTSSPYFSTNLIFTGFLCNHYPLSIFYCNVRKKITCPGPDNLIMFCDNVIILSINFIKIHVKENSSAWVTETVPGDEKNSRSYVQVSNCSSTVSLNIQHQSCNIRLLILMETKKLSTQNLTDNRIS